MDYDYVLPFITYMQELEFGCLIPSLFEEINQSIEERRFKNSLYARNSRIKKNLLKDSLETKVIQYRNLYKSKFGREFVFKAKKTYNIFKTISSMSRQEKMKISARKCRYNKKRYIEQLQEEINQLHDFFI